ncbi:MAG: OmpA family protein [Prevotellaceae bacterium]|jgi:OOP family OmpA-OmpF porin|nr:OmpA family protein [Prevotellaceae bacterium]
MKKITILTLCLCPMLALAQPSEPVQLSEPAQPDDTLGVNIHVSRLSVGLKGGLNFASMSYSSETYDAYSRSLFGRGLFGLTAEYAFSDKLSVKPDMIFIGRGVKISDGFTYKVRLKAFDINLPALYYFKLKNSQIRPYAMAGLSFTFARGGDITLDDYAVDVAKSNMAGAAVGLRIGAGAKIPLSALVSIPSKYFKGAAVSGEVAYHYGLTDTYGAAEKDGSARSYNVPNYTIEGTRKHRGVEVSVSVLVPLANFIKRKPPRLPEPEPEPEPVAAQVLKDCYSVSEIVEEVRSNGDITGKKICLQTITFETNKATLKAQSEKYIDEIALLMESIPTLNVRINGHTDNVGNAERNLKLSVQRAEAVYRYMLKKGISSERLSYEGFGSSKPLQEGNTEAARLRNRRVEFEIMHR